MLALFDTGTIKIIVAIFMGLSLYYIAFFALVYNIKNINYQILAYVLYLISFSGVILFLLIDSRNLETFNYSNLLFNNGFRYSWLIIILPVILNAINYIFNRITSYQVNHRIHHDANQVVNHNVKQVLDYDVNQDSNKMVNEDVKQDIKHYKNKNVNKNIVYYEKKTVPFPIQFAYTVFLAPTIEEIIFRGILFWHINFKFGFISAMILNSMIFAFLHLKIRVIIFSFIGGIIFSYLTYKCNSLYAAIIAHCLYNFLSLLPGICGKINFILSKSLQGNT